MRIQPDSLYRFTHRRLKLLRGSAVEHTCPCGELAGEWAYDHDDPYELHTRRGSPFSLDLGRYVAMCHPCHMRLDLEHPGIGPRGLRIREMREFVPLPDLPEIIVERC